MSQLIIADPMQACFVADFYHGNPVDFGKLGAASWNGVKCPAVIMKATQGAGYADPAFKARVAAARAASLLVGAYHFGTAESTDAQAKNFLAAVGDDPNIALYLDFEDNRASQMSLAQAIEFMGGVDFAVGRTCGIYSGNTLKQGIIHATQAQRDFLAAHAFWGCEYGAAFVMKDANGHPLPWDVPFLWQFTGDGNGPLPHSLDGLEQGADLSIFKGSAEQLRAAWPLPQQVTS